MMNGTAIDGLLARVDRLVSIVPDWLIARLSWPVLILCALTVLTGPRWCAPVLGGPILLTISVWRHGISRTSWWLIALAMPALYSPAFLLAAWATRIHHHALVTCSVVLVAMMLVVLVKGFTRVLREVDGRHVGRHPAQSAVVAEHRRRFGECRLRIVELFVVNTVLVAVGNPVGPLCLAVLWRRSRASAVAAAWCTAIAGLIVVRGSHVTFDPVALPLAVVSSWSWVRASRTAYWPLPVQFQTIR